MDRLIIDNRTNRTLLDVLPRIQQILETGRVSNDGKQHSYATRWADGMVIESVLNDKSERFCIYMDKGHGIGTICLI